MTMLCDCKTTENSRFFTYAGGNSNDLIPLTTSTFLGKIPVSGVPDLDHFDKSNFNKTSTEFTKCLKKKI